MESTVKTGVNQLGAPSELGRVGLAHHNIFFRVPFVCLSVSPPTLQLELLEHISYDSDSELIYVIASI